MKTYKYSKTVFNIPHKFKESTLENFTFSENAKLPQTIEEFLNKDIQGLILYGRPGVGKTHLAVSLYKILVFGDLSKAMFIPFRELCDLIKSGYGENKDYLKEIEKYEYLIIDDIFSGNTTAKDNDILSTIIQNRYNSDKCFILTTNIKPEEADQYFNYHESSRLFGMGVWYEVKSTKDWRTDV